MKVFLGGTVADTTWRNYMMPKLKVDYFNPVVKEWDNKAYEREIYERKHCDICLYVLTPRAVGWYSYAEVVDDSYKKPDNTIFCYIEEDRDKKFTDEQIKELKEIGKMVKANGAVLKESLDDVIAFLNTADIEESAIETSKELNNVFISYGRRHSLGFARKLYNNLTDKGYDVWFDMNDIPLGVDFQQQIDDGIKKADNFIYIISPHSVKSVYCLKEVILALKYNKRIIPLLHIEPNDCWDKMHPVIGKLNWIYFRQTENFDIPLEEWEFIDDFDAGFAGLTSLIDSHKDYLRLHTYFLDKALSWDKYHNSSKYLLIGKDREIAENWILKKTFRLETGQEVQAPTTPTDIHAEYICESKKNAINLLTDVFISYSREDIEVKEKIQNSLNRSFFTTWSDTSDIQSGIPFELAIKNGIEEASNFLFLISKHSIKSKFCLSELEIAVSLNKRIISILAEPTNLDKIPGKLRSIEYIDITNRKEKEKVEIDGLEDVEAEVDSRKSKSPYEESIDKLIKTLHIDNIYYGEHRTILTQALRWKDHNELPSMLMKGYYLENSKTWLKLGAQKSEKPTKIHQYFINKSIDNSAIVSSEVYISYCKVDKDFAVKLNRQLKISGKTTWFDKDNIPGDVDFQENIHSGIDNSDNFIFILSPDSAKNKESAFEIEYAQKNNKRVIILSFKKVDDNKIPLELKDKQIIDFDNSDFYKAYSILQRSLDVDRGYVQNHTKYLQQAIDWRDNNKDESRLLRGNEYIFAETWLLSAYKTEEQEFTDFKSLSDKKTIKKPVPSKIQLEFVEESKEAILAKERQEKEHQEKLLLLEKEKAETAERAAKRQKLFTIAVSFALIAAILLGIYGFVQSNRAKNSARIAKSEEIAAFAFIEEENDPSLSIRLAEAANKINKNPDIITLLHKIYSRNLFSKIVGREMNEKGFSCVAFSPNNKHFVTGSFDGYVRLYDINGKLIKQFFPKRFINNIDISPDGKYIAVAYADTIVNMLDFEGNIIKSFRGHKKEVLSVKFSNSGKYLLSGGKSTTAILWDMKGNIVQTFVGHKKGIVSVNFNKNDTKILTGSADYTAILWNIEGNELQVFKGHTYKLTSAIFSPTEDKIITTSLDNSARLWDFEGNLIKSFSHPSGVRSMVFFPNGKHFATSCDDNLIRFFDLNGRVLNTFRGHINKLVIAISKDASSLLSASVDQTIRKWKIPMELFPIVLQHEGKVNSVAFSNNNEYVLTAAWDKTVRIWNKTGKELLRINCESGVFDANFSPDMKYIIIGTEDPVIKLWDLEKFPITENFKVWDFKNNTAKRFEGHTDGVLSVDFSNNANKIVSASKDGTVIIWDLNGNLLKRIKAHDNQVNIARFMPDDNSILTASKDNRVKLWSIDGELIQTFNGHYGSAYSVEFNEKNNQILTASDDRTFRLWDIKEGKEFRQYVNIESSIKYATFSPDKSKILTSGDAKKAKLWDLNGNLHQIFEGHANGVKETCFASDGAYIATASWDSTARIWKVKPEYNRFLKLNEHEYLSPANKIKFGVVEFENILETVKEMELPEIIEYFEMAVDKTTNDTLKRDYLLKMIECSKKSISMNASAENLTTYFNTLSILTTIYSRHSRKKDIQEMINQTDLIFKQITELKNHDQLIVAADYFSDKLNERKKSDYQLNLGEKLLTICNLLYDKIDNNNEIANRIIDYAGKKSFCLLYDKKYDTFLKFTELVGKIDSKNIYYNKNILIAYILNDRFEEAKSIFINNNNIKLKISLRQMYLTDFEDLKSYNISHLDFDKFREFIKK